MARRQAGMHCPVNPALHMQVSPASMPTTWRVPVSSEALCLSFGHFLELSFGAHQLKVDDKDLHGDFVRYLGMGELQPMLHVYK